MPNWKYQKRHRLEAWNDYLIYGLFVILWISIGDYHADLVEQLMHYLLVVHERYDLRVVCRSWEIEIVNLVSVRLYGTLISWLHHFKLDTMMSELLFIDLTVIHLRNLFSPEPHSLYDTFLLLVFFKHLTNLSHDLRVNVLLKWILRMQRLLVGLPEVSIWKREVYCEWHIQLQTTLFVGLEWVFVNFYIPIHEDWGPLFLLDLVLFLNLSGNNRVVKLLIWFKRLFEYDYFDGAPLEVTNDKLVPEYDET